MRLVYPSKFFLLSERKIVILLPVFLNLGLNMRRRVNFIVHDIVT